MNKEECRQFVVKHKPICCNSPVETVGYSLPNSIQYFICRTCQKTINVNYWPLYQEDIRQLKLNSIIDNLI